MAFLNYQAGGEGLQCWKLPPSQPKCPHDVPIIVIMYFMVQYIKAECNQCKIMEEVLTCHVEKAAGQKRFS